MEKIKVDIFSDYICPFCYMGKRNLEKAIKNLKLEDIVEINIKAYELDENAPKDMEENKLKYDYMLEHSDKPIGIIMAETREVIEQAKDIELDFNYDIMLTANTRDAHRLTKYAATKGKQKEFSEIVMDSYFNKGANLNDKNKLLELAQKAGLDKIESNRVLNSNDFEEEVIKDKYDAFQYQVESVPFFLFEDRYGASGKQTVKVFEDALTQIIEFNDKKDK